MAKKDAKQAIAAKQAFERNANEDQQLHTGKSAQRHHRHY
jgi:hypothetical protein